MDLTGRVVLVTGATGGLGSRLCLALAARGARIGIAYRGDHATATALADKVRQGGGEALPLAADLTNQTEVEELLSKLQYTFGSLDGLVLNSGANQLIAFDDLDGLTPEIWHKLLEWNLTAHYLVARSAAPLLRERGGAVVTVTSDAGIKPAGSSIGYAVAKAGLIHLTKCLAVALAPTVRVNSVAPGFMEDTKMSGSVSSERGEAIKASKLLGRSSDKHDVAAVILMLLENESLTGQTVVVDAGGLG